LSTQHAFAPPGARSAGVVRRTRLLDPAAATAPYAEAGSGVGDRPRPTGAALVRPRLAGRDDADACIFIDPLDHAEAHSKAVFTLRGYRSLAEPACPGTFSSFFAPLRRTRLQRRSSSLRLATRVAAWGVGEFFSFRAAAAGRARACQRHARTGRRAGGIVGSARQRVAFQTVPYSRCLRGACAPPPAGRPVAVGRGDNHVSEYFYEPCLVSEKVWVWIPYHVSLLLDK